MNKITKGVIGASIVLSLMVPALTQAASLTTAQVDSVISLLQSFGVDSKTVDTVKNVLNRTASSTPGQMPPGQLGKRVCQSLMHDLGIGERGEDVRDLQEMLREESDVGFTAESTGYYGPKTAEAVRRFQEKYRIASTTTGTVGPVTRGFLERRCGKGLGKGEDKGKVPPPRRDGGPEHASSTPESDD